MNDKETAEAAGAIGAAAGGFKNDVDKASTLAKADKDAAKKDVDVLIKQADTVKSRTSGGKPATADLRQLLDQVAKVEAFVGAHPIAAHDELAGRADLARQAPAGLRSDAVIVAGSSRYPIHWAVNAMRRGKLL